MAIGSLTGVYAQVMQMYPGTRITLMSENGRYLVDSNAGIGIYDIETGNSYTYGSGYSRGGGAAISSTGVLVGSGSDYTQALYWENGEWNVLPIDATNISYARADGISDDGSIIVGTVDMRSITRKQWPMIQPVMWLRGEDGKYSSAELLPFPDTDITGCTPQQVSAYYVASDGKRILGQMMDLRGILQYQVIYTKGDDGTWSAEISGEGLQVKEGSQWPPYPTRPTRPQEADYLTQAEIAEYNAAVKEYNEALEIASLTGVYPTYPQLISFIKENKEKYEADMAEYTKALREYNDGFTAFNNAYLNNISGYTFEFNSEVMSHNGKYYAGNMVYPDPTFEGSLADASSWLSPMMFDLDTPDDKGLLVNAQSLSVFTVLDNGDVVCAAPASDLQVYFRTPYIVRKGHEGEPLLLEEWLKETSTPAYEWIKENCSFDLAADQTGTGQPQNDVLVIGSVRMDSNGRRMISYFVNPETGQYDSYFIDFDAQVSIDNIASDFVKPFVSVNGRTLVVDNSVTLVEVYDLAGRKLITATGTTDLGSVQGVVVVKTTTNDGRVSATKLTVQG